MAEAGPRGNARAPAAAGRGGAGPAAPDTFDELRELLIGPEQRELLALQARLLDPTVQTREVSRVLPDAIALRSDNPQLTRALAPSVEEAITSSVRRDPRPLADALFPVIGPAIRKAITHTLAGMMDSLNRTIEHSVSWRALQWRWTAFRTGKPFAEIVLLNTLRYRVEQVFLIHAETGLVLQHLSHDPRASRDADQVSGMLTAIRDFARDSFRVAGSDSIETMRIGDLDVMVVQGPHAILAGEIRGTAPLTVRVIFEDALESVHRQFSPELKAFHGDAAPFERARPILETCLVSQFQPRTKAPSYRRWVVVGAAILLALGAWLALGIRDQQRWNAYVQRLRAEPGIVVMSSGRRAGRFFVAGLRDPLARDPATLTAGTGVTAGSFESQWEPYQALHPAFVTARGRDLLRPPDGVTLAYRDGVMTASGAAPDRWIVQSERLAPAIAGVRQFSYAGVAPDVRIKQQLERLVLIFPKGEAVFAPGQDEVLGQAAQLMAGLNEVASLRGEKDRVDIVGHADADGTDDVNAPLSEARAEAVRRLVGAAHLDALELVARGVSTADPLAPGITEEDKARNRRVSFRVHLNSASTSRTLEP